MKKAICAMAIILILFMPGCTYKTQEVKSPYSNDIESTNESNQLYKESPSNQKESPDNKTEGKASPSIQQKPYKTFHYQLQGTDFNKLKSLNVDYLIIDIDDSELTEVQVEELKKDKIVLSYLSIGEAEDYRGYWQDSWEVGSPDFLDVENPNWQGNYLVKYWDKRWQDIIQDSLQRIISKGYDGVYLDTVDSYQYYLENSRDDAADEMEEFVVDISRNAKAQSPEFLVMVQNAVELYDLPEFKSNIDGFGKEDTWYIDNDLKEPDETDYELSYLDRAISDEKIVLAIDYPSGNSKICDFYQKCRAHKFICTVSDRELDMDEPVACNQ